MTETKTIFEWDSGAVGRGPAAVLTCGHGLMRGILMSALKDMDLYGRSNASADFKSHWARRAGVVRGLLDQLPAAPNPRDLFEDMPDEPTPEEADRAWRERAAAEDSRAAARRETMKRERPDEEDLLTGPPDHDANVERFCAPTYDDDDLLA